jgi:hypothetical protein
VAHEPSVGPEADALAVLPASGDARTLETRAPSRAEKRFAVEGVVITVLLIVGSMCVLAQAYISLRANKPRKVETTTSAPPAPARGSKAAQATTPAPDAEQGPGAAKRLTDSVVRVLQEQGSESSTLGYLGLVLLGIAVALVLNISVAVSFST